MYETEGIEKWYLAKHEISNCFVGDDAGFFFDMSLLPRLLLGFKKTQKKLIDTSFTPLR